MPRIAELTAAEATPSMAKMMTEQERHFGFVLNPLKVLGYCPTIAEGLQELTQGIEAAGKIEGRLRSLLFSRVASLNGCPF
jgi:alkylhydroperoxidase family enzyme